ncbi:protein FAR1-RELATED SEQUENCE 5-like [Primulina eburnea]|uniref:protein FAR1-RELATED SEQUENCE 5-like n=1 Tax=Primulina eburnea TaxID=1245227 RepID=UPI003C6BE4E7
MYTDKTLIDQQSFLMDCGSDIEFKPKIGMKFDSLDETWKYWVEYGGKIGFGVKKHYFNKNKNTGFVTSYKYVCCKEGVRKQDKSDSLTLNPRVETRTNCKVRLGVTFDDGKYKVTAFIEENNHPLHLQETFHRLASQRNVTEVQAYEIDLAVDVGLKRKSTFQLMSGHAGGRDGLGYTMLDAKNYIRSKRQRNMVYGEVGCLMRYFQQQLSKNPSFYHANQMDVEEQITNVFWADARMLIDYEYFGDVVSLDTTYCNNRAYRPLAIFSGFNHHRGAVIFGATLLYDETAASFKWLFETFLEAHKQKRPLTIFTDQDQAMAKALKEVMPEIFHGLCTWHFMQNGIKHLGNLMKDGSHFLTDFKRCMYGIDDETQFEEAWIVLLAQYNIHENTRLQSTSSIEEKWAACYMKKAFTLGMRSTQLSESINSDIKICMKPDLDIMQFFKHFEQVLKNKRYNELRWTRKARSGVVHDNMGNKVKEDPKLESTERYRKLCMMLVRLATEASIHPSTFTLVHNSLCDLTKQVMEMRLTEAPLNHPQYSLEAMDFNGNISNTYS